MTRAIAARPNTKRPFRMIAGVSSLTDLVDGGALMAVNGGGTAWRVNPTAGKGDFTTIQGAVDVASVGDAILIDGATEYDEDVTISTRGLSLIGVGPRHSIRVTGVAAGTSTALTIDGVDDVSIYNLNLEGRSGGGGLVINDVSRRVTLVGCRLHGGDAAASIVSNPSSVGWVTFDDCQFASSAIGLSVTNAGGGITQQVVVRNSLFWSITTDCIVQSGFSQNWIIDGNTFAGDAGTEPTRFLDIDDASTTGLVCNNTFATTVQASSKMAIASGVLYVNNRTEREQPGTDAFATSGRPD